MSRVLTRRDGETEEIAAMRERLEDDGLCHLLDDQLQALCFADISGKRVHPAVQADSGHSGFVCAPPPIGCGRQRCPACASIDDALGKRSSA